MSLRAGTRVGPYEIVAPIGFGGMGEVYRALDTRLNRHVAVKVLTGEMALDRRLRERFEQEARSVAALSHPNICTVYDVGRHAGRDYLVMELLQGETLADRLTARGPLDVDEAVRIAMQVLDALQAAHSRGIVHRDLKPGNIFLVQPTDARAALVKLLDFGLAKAPATAIDVTAAATVAVPATEAGLIVGTVSYMSPEQAEGLLVDARSDLFSFGTVLYEMLTGRRPFDGTSSAATLAAVLRGDPLPIVQVRAGVPGPLAAAVSRLLAKDPRARFASAADVKRALDGGLADGSTAVVDARVAPAPPSIAVLPFGNLSADPENEFFAEGLAAEIIADLASIRALRVISRSSANRFKSADRHLPAVASELGVRYVLEGSVRRAGATLRVTAQLVDAHYDTHLWAEKFSGSVDDVFGIQEEISRRIVAALKVRLTSSEDRRLGARPFADGHAYEWYLRARHELYLWTPDGLQRAGAYIRQAVEIAGENALFHAMDGYVEWMHVNTGMSSDEAHLLRAEACARRALALDPASADGIFLCGLVAALRGGLEEGVRDLVAAHEQRPGDANVLTELTRFLFNAGQDDPLRASLDTLLAVDPLTPVCRLCQAAVHTGRGEYGAALTAVRRMLPLTEPASPIWLLAAWQVLVPTGERTEGRRMLEHAAAQAGSPTYRSLARFFLAALDQDPVAAAAHLTPEVEAAALWQEHLARMIAEAYAQLGQPDEAIRWLRVSIGRGMIHYRFLAVHDVLLEPIRPHPRFQDLMRAVRRRWESFPPVTLVR